MRLKVRLKDKRTGEIATFANIGLNNDVDRSDGTDEDVFFALKEDRFYSLAELNERFEDAPEEKRYGGRVPKIDERYFFLASEGSIVSEIWEFDGADKARFESGSAFWTKEEAERELARRKAYVILKEDTKGFKPDWGTNIPKNVVTWKGDIRGYLFAEDVYGLCNSCLCFATKEDAQDSIESHEKEWKVWLGVEDE